MHQLSLIDDWEQALVNHFHLFLPLLEDALLNIIV